jgi:hypothetical protein
MQHDDEKDPGTAALAAVAGLARSVETLTRDVAAIKQGLQHTASAAALSQLAQVVTNLGEALSTPRRGGKDEQAEPVPSWLNLPADSDAAQKMLGELLPWLHDVYLRYGDARRTLPACWLWHGEIVEELVWLMGAWQLAYQGPDASYRLAGDWHDRQRPGVARRIGDLYAAGCDLLTHRDQPAPAAAVPLADAAEAIVAWWATDRDLAGPVPTAEQVRAARPGGLSIVADDPHNTAGGY